jgi:uncharacterized RDD family membrane protein YckC
MSGSELDPYRPPADEPLVAVPAELTEDLAGIPARLAARAIDVVLIQAWSISIALGLERITETPVVGITAHQLGLASGAWLAGNYNNAPLGFFVLVALGLPIYVLQSVLISTRGVTVGKALVRIKIVDAHGRPPGFLRGVLLRELTLPIAGFVLPGLLVQFVDLAPGLGRSRRTLHDMMARTRVVRAVRVWDGAS